MKTNTFASRIDQSPITYYIWEGAKPPQGVVLVAHGLGEHALRYDRFAGVLNQEGYAVYAIDHRGHGASRLPDRELGDFGEGGWNALCDDVLALREIIERDYPDVPTVLLGHSMGSFAGQQIAMGNSDRFAAVILSGSSSNDKLLEAMMAAGPDALGFKFFNRAFEPRRTDFDWLSRDEAEVDKYVADPLCGFELNEASLGTMVEASFQLADPALIDRIRKDLPVLLMSGDNDPVGGNLTFLQILEERWRGVGVASIDTQYYEGGRHEMLNETNRDEVTQGLVDWIKTTLDIV